MIRGLSVFSLISLLIIGSAWAQPKSFDEALKEFMSERCHPSVLIKTISTENTLHEVAPGYTDFIFDSQLVIFWQPKDVTIEDQLVISIVNQAEGPWYTFDGSGAACDFKNLPGYGR